MAGLKQKKPRGREVLHEPGLLEFARDPANRPYAQLALSESANLTVSRKGVRVERGWVRHVDPGSWYARLSATPAQVR